MATATITFTDAEDGSLQIDVAFNPVIDMSSEEDAPASALYALHALRACESVQAEEDYE